jgi:hypothetical protein
MAGVADDAHAAAGVRCRGQRVADAVERERHRAHRDRGGRAVDERDQRRLEIELADGIVAVLPASTRCSLVLRDDSGAPASRRLAGRRLGARYRERRRDAAGPAGVSPAFRS